MDQGQRINLLSRLISEPEISKQLRPRKQSYDYTSISLSKPQLITEMQNEGWEIDKQHKTSVKLKKQKKTDIAFEDKVWSLFALMGFKVLNRDRHLNLPYNTKQNLTQQIDVFAKDDETVLLVECKTSDQLNKKVDFKKELEATKGQMSGLIGTVQHKLFPDEHLKIKYIFATKNIALGDQDRERIKNLNGVYFDEETIDYYLELYKHLGLAARYQLLGMLFQGQDIPEIDNKIPAVRGKMGPHTYYSFSIEPEKLLKIGYVLHRSRVNSDLIPTYQRLIKKSRLAKIKDFIDEDEGYFANSIVISLDSYGKNLQFDLANTQSDSSITSVGILHLPKKYMSAYIIDGQHRLYGYSESRYKTTNSIPVVAFVDLDRSEQVKLFMDINENQKAVPKNLRSTLDADLKWNSDSYSEQFTALSSRIAIKLGEARTSPLFGLVSIGEDKRIITQDPIIKALKEGNLIGSATKKSIERMGTFYRGDIDDSYAKLSAFLIAVLDRIKDGLPEEWGSDNSAVTNNRTIYALIRILSDIVDHGLKQGIFKENSSVKEIVEKSNVFIDAIVDYYKKITPEQKQNLSVKLGYGAYVYYWRNLQKVIRNQYPQFQPPGLDEYEEKESKQFNTEAFDLISRIEKTLNRKFKQLLMEYYGDNWFEMGVPENIQDDAAMLAQKKKRQEKRAVSPWSCLYLINYRSIAMKNVNWTQIFEREVTLPDEINKRGGKDAKTEWMQRLSDLRNQIAHNSSISKEEFDFIVEMNEFINGDTA